MPAWPVPTIAATVPHPPISCPVLHARDEVSTGFVEKGPHWPVIQFLEDFVRRNPKVRVGRLYYLHIWTFHWLHCIKNGASCLGPFWVKHCKFLTLTFCNTLAISHTTWTTRKENLSVHCRSSLLASQVPRRPVHFYSSVKDDPFVVTRTFSVRRRPLPALAGRSEYHRNIGRAFPAK